MTMRIAINRGMIHVSLLMVAAALALSCSSATKTGAPPEPTGGHPESRSLPTSVTPPGGAAPLTGITALTAGGYHTCSLSQQRRLLCWGDDEYGQLGDGTTADRAVAGEAKGLTGEIAQIAAGFYHTCVIVRGGALTCWGYNVYGQVGDGTTDLRTAPTEIAAMQSSVTDVAPGRDHTCALKGGQAWCWGYNAYGEVGDGTAERVRPTPVQVSGLSGGLTSIGSGWFHSCALSAARTVVCWGNNRYGELGNGEMGAPRVATPVVVTGLPDDVVAMALGGAHNCVLTATGGVKCWGRNNYGQLGDGTMTDRSTPVDVVGLPNDVVAIAAGTGQTCALTRSGGVKCWGHDWYGELGDGTSGVGNVVTHPVDVRGLPSGVTSLTMGRFHTCVLAGSGRVWCWGRNGFGEIGDGTRARRLAPVPVLGVPTKS